MYRTLIIMFQTTKRKVFLPTLANCVDFGGGKASVTHSLKTDYSEIIHLPTIQRLTSPRWQSSGHLNQRYICSRRSKASETATRKLYSQPNLQNQKSVQILPTVMEAAEITGRNPLLPGKI